MLFDNAFSTRSNALQKKIQQLFLNLDNNLDLLNSRLLNILIALYWDGFCEELCSSLKKYYQKKLEKESSAIPSVINLLCLPLINALKNSNNNDWNSIDSRLWEALKRGEVSFSPCTSNDFFFKDPKITSLKTSFLGKVLPPSLLEDFKRLSDSENDVSDFFTTLKAQLNSIYQTRNNFVHVVFSDRETFSVTQVELKTLKDSFENINRFIEIMEKCLIDNDYLDI